MRRALPPFAARFVLVAALVLTWALAIGRYGGPDEPAHVLRAYAAAHGDLVGDPADPLPPGYRLVTVPASLASGDPSCYRHDAGLTSACAAASGDTDPVRAATSAGLTPPLYHLVVGTLARALGDAGSTTSYRVAAALLHALVLALAFHRARGRPALVAILAAITPAAWFLMGVVNPSSLEVAVAMLAWVGVRRLADSVEVELREAWWIAAPLAVAIAVRPIAIVTAAAVLLVVALRRDVRPVRWALVTPPAVAAVAVAIWSVAVRATLDDPRTAVHRSVVASITDSLGSLGETAYDAVASLGWNEVLAPRVASIAWALVWFALVAATVQRGRRGGASTPLRAPLVWLALVVATPVVFETVMAGSVGPIWQGRYSLPALLGIAAVVDWPVSGRRTTIGVIGMAAFVEIVTYWATVRRYAVGTRGSWWLDGAVHSSVWLSPRAWLAVHAGVIATIAAVALGARRQVK